MGSLLFAILVLSNETIHQPLAIIKNMRKALLYVLIFLFYFSCRNTNKKLEPTIYKKDTISNQIVKIDSTKAKNNDYGVKTVTVKVLSLEERLIMPSDYLTTAMTVKTSSNDTLVFLDMDGFEKLLNQKIKINYKLIPGSKLLVCFDCNSYSGKIELYDITAFPSDVKFMNLKLKKYIPDPYIVPASQFKMITNEEKTETFYSNKNDLILDSIKMVSSFNSYGVLTKSYPELQNRKELELLIK